MRVLSRLRGSLAQRTLPALQLTSVRCGRGPRGTRASRETPFAVPPAYPHTRKFALRWLARKEGFEGATDRRGRASDVRTARGSEGSVGVC